VLAAGECTNAAGKRLSFKLLLFVQFQDFDDPLEVGGAQKVEDACDIRDRSVECRLIEESVVPEGVWPTSDGEPVSKKYMRLHGELCCLLDGVGEGEHLCQVVPALWR
jgi:hypothetical protein